MKTGATKTAWSVKKITYCYAGSLDPRIHFKDTWCDRSHNFLPLNGAENTTVSYPMGSEEPKSRIKR